MNGVKYCYMMEPKYIVEVEGTLHYLTEVGFGVWSTLAISRLLCIENQRYVYERCSVGSAFDSNLIQCQFESQSRN